jgi:hypothetical protein
MGQAAVLAIGSSHRLPLGAAQGLGKVPRCPFRPTSWDWSLCLPTCGFRWEGGTTGCLRHVTFATKRDFAGTLGSSGRSDEPGLPIFLFVRLHTCGHSRHCSDRFVGRGELGQLLAGCNAPNRPAMVVLAGDPGSGRPGCLAARLGSGTRVLLAGRLEVGDVGRDSNLEPYSSRQSRVRGPMVAIGAICERPSGSDCSPMWCRRFALPSRTSCWELLDGRRRACPPEEADIEQNSLAGPGTCSIWGA